LGSTDDDVAALVARLIQLLQRPNRGSIWRRPFDWLTGRSQRHAEWRAETLAFFSDLAEQLDSPSESFAGEAHHLLRWMDWDLELKREPREVANLVGDIQDALYRREASRRQRQ
jgi:hypothetical protein